MKKIFALSTAAVLAASPAVAAPYVNVESNSGFSDGDHNSTLLEPHVGYESPLGEDAAWYIQGGPAVSFPDDAEQVGAASGKVGLSVAVTKRLSAYGEVSAITPEGLELEGLGVGTKAGLKYSF